MLRIARTVTGLLALALVLAACGGGDTTADGDATTPSATATAEDTADDETTTDDEMAADDETAADDTDDTDDAADTGAGDDGDEASTDDEPADDAGDGETTTEDASTADDGDSADGTDGGTCDREASTIQLEAVNFAFEQAELEVCRGDTIEFTPLQGSHSFTSSSAGIDTGVFSGGSETVTVDAEPGSYDFFCSLHSQMQGTLIVQGG